MEPWQQIELGGNPKHEGTEQKIDRENIHGAVLGRPAIVQSGLTDEANRRRAAGASAASCAQAERAVRQLCDEKVEQ